MSICICLGQSLHSILSLRAIFLPALREFRHITVAFESAVVYCRTVSKTLGPHQVLRRENSVHFVENHFFCKVVFRALLFSRYSPRTIKLWNCSLVYYCIIEGTQ